MSFTRALCSFTDKNNRRINNDPRQSYRVGPKLANQSSGKILADCSQVVNTVGERTTTIYGVDLRVGVAL